MDLPLILQLDNPRRARPDDTSLQIIPLGGAGEIGMNATTYRYREELFPSLTFRRAFDALCARPAGRADIEYVRILHLAAGTMESVVETSLATLLASGEEFDYARVKQLAAPEPQMVPLVSIPKVDLAFYDRLLGETAGAA